MALTSVPQFILGQFGAVSRDAITLDGADERVAHCGFFCTPDGATRHIEALCWATGNVTTGDDILVQLEGVGADGLPSGIIAAGVSGTEAIADGEDYIWVETPLGTHYDLTSGTWLAVTMKKANAGAGVTVSYGHHGGSGTGANFTWLCTDIVGAATWIKALGISNVALKCSTGEYIFPLGGHMFEYPTTLVIANNHDDPSVRYVGNKIICGVGARLIGAFVLSLDMDVDISIQLTSSDGTLIVGDDAATNMDVPIDSEYRTGTVVTYYSFIRFPCPKTLLASTAYYLIFNPDSATDTTIYFGSFESEAIKNLSCCIPTGWSATYVQSFEPISFVETTTRICGIMPVFDQMDLGGAARVGQILTPISSMGPIMTI